MGSAHEVIFPKSLIVHSRLCVEIDPVASVLGASSRDDAGLDELVPTSSNGRREGGIGLGVAPLFGRCAVTVGRMKGIAVTMV